MGEEDPRGGDGMPVGGGSARGGAGQAWWGGWRDCDQGGAAGGTGGSLETSLDQLPSWWRVGFLKLATS